MGCFPSFHAKLALRVFYIVCERDAKLSFRVKLNEGDCSLEFSRQKCLLSFQAKLVLVTFLQSASVQSGNLSFRAKLS